ncbi:MAG: molybdate ABC transporter substrate-binding protein [Gammaproteobacteria bacterium]
MAVASNFSAPMQEIASRFEQETGHTVNISLGSSGRFFAQISNGAPFQVFLSADQDKPLRLEQAGLTVAGSRFTYAQGRLVLWSADETLLEDSTEILYTDNFQRLALANPRLAPYGQAALEVLQELNLVERTQDRWVMGENIAQAYQFVETGNAELGFVALSQVSGADGFIVGSGWVLPGNLYSPINQDAVLLTAGEDCQACRELLQYMQSIQVRRLIESYGYRVN